MVIIISHYKGSLLNNQDSMESKSFFFVAPLKIETTKVCC